MNTETDVARPDPRRAGSWCQEGVAHDHQACGSLWNSSDPGDVEAAARWADERGEERRARMRQAAVHLRSPYLCNWDVVVASALADWLDATAGGTASETQADAVADALLGAFGIDRAGST